MEENQKFLDSIQGHLNQFTSAYQALAANTIDSSAIKTVVDMGTGVIKLVDALHLIPAAIAGAGIFGAYHGGKAFNAWIKTSIQGLAQLGASLKALKGADFSDMSDGNISKLKSEFDKLDARQLNVVLSTNKVTEAQAKAILTAMGYSEAQMGVATAHLAVENAQNKAADGVGEIGKAAETAGGKLISFKNVLGGVKQSIATAFSANPIGMTASVILGVVALVSSVINTIREKQREVIAEGERVLSEYQTNVQSVEQDIASLGDVSERFKTLQRGVTADHKNISLSNEEYAEYRQILQQLIDLNPSLISGYDARNQAIIKENISIDEQIEKLKELRKETDRALISDASKVMRAFNAKVNHRSIFAKFDESLARQMHEAKAVMQKLDELAEQKNWDGSSSLIMAMPGTGAKWLSSIGLVSDEEGVFSLSPEDIKKIRVSYEALTHEISQEVEKLKPVVRASFQLDVAFAGGKDGLGKEFLELSDTLKSGLMNVVDNVSTEIYQSFGADDSVMTAWFKENFLYPVAENADDVQKTLQGAFDLDRSLMTGETKVKDYLDKVGKASAEMWSIYSAEQRAALEGQNIDLPEVFDFGTYAEQAQRLADGITEVVGSASLASEMLGSLKFTELERLHNVLQEMKDEGENVREFADLVMKAYGDPAFAENLQTLREQLDSGSISQTTFNQKLREMAEALGFTGPALERFVDAFADAPQQIENFDDFLDGIQDKIKKLRAAAEGASDGLSADELIDFVQAFGSDLNELNVDFNDVTAGNIQNIVQQIENHSINRKLNELEDHYESILSGLRNDLDELNAQIESETDSEALDGLRTRQAELQDAISTNQSLMTFYQGAVKGLTETNEAAYSLQNTLSALSGAVSEANGYFDEYNKNGFLSLDSVQKLLEAHPNYVKYLIKEGDQYKLNQAALDDLNRAEELQGQAMDEYVDRLREMEFGSKAFVDTFDEFLDAVSASYPDSGLSDVIAKIKEINGEFRDGKDSVVDYFNNLQEQIASISFDSLQNEDSQALFAGLSLATSQGFEYITRQFASGSIGALDYADAIGEASENLLNLHVTSQNLTQTQDGLWVNAAGEVDEYANSLQAALDDLDSFDSFITTFAENFDYFTEHLEGNHFVFTAEDEASPVFQEAAAAAEASLEEMYIANREAFDKVVSDISAASGLSVQEIVDANGDITDGLMNNASTLSAFLDSNFAQLQTSIEAVKQAAGAVISNLGETIRNFHYSISFTPSYHGDEPLGWSILKSMFKKDVTLSPINIDIKGGGAEGVADALSAIGSAVSSFETPELPIALKPQVPNVNTAAPRVLDKTAKAQKEVNKALQEYLKLLEHRKAMGEFDDSPQEYIDGLQYALDHYAKTQDEVWNLEEKIYAARQKMLEDEKHAREEAARAEKQAAEERKRAAKEAYEAEKKAAEEAYQAEGEALKEKKSELDRIYSAAVKTLDAEIERLQKVNEELGKELEHLKEKYAKTQSAVLRVLDDEIDRLKKQNDLRKEQLDLVKDQLEETAEKYKGAQSAVVDLLDRELQQLKERLDLIGKAAEAAENDAGKAHAAVLDVLERQKDQLEEQKDLLDELYQPRIDAIQAEIDRLSDANDERKKAIQLEKAKQELEKARNQKSIRVYREGEGFVYENDTETVASAQEELRELELQEKLDSLGKQKEDLEQQLADKKAALDKQIDALDKYRDQWSDILDEYEKQQNREIALKLFGVGWEEKILGHRMEILEDFRERYLAIQQDLADAETEREALEDKIGIIEEYKKRWAEFISDYDKKQDTLHAAELLGADWEKKILSLRLDVLDRFSKDYFVIQDKLADTSKEEEANQNRIDMLEEYREKWTSFIDDYEAQQDRYIADQILGAGWEQDVLAGRMEVLEEFQSGYLDIVRRLNDVEEERRSYEERIELLQGYKEAWADAVDAYEDEQDRLAAAQRWGADWEEQILNGRVDNLEDFRDAYVRIMEELAEWEKNKPDFPDFDDSDYDWDDGNYDYDDDYDYGGSSSKRPSSGSDRGDDDNRGGIPRVGQSVTVRSGETRWASGSGGVRMHDWVPGSTFTVMQIKGSQVLIGRNGQWTGWVDVSQLKGYRKGTLFAEAGPHVVDDAGTEILVRGNPAQGRVTSLEAGDGVVPSEPTQNLMSLAKAAPDFIALRDAMQNADFDIICKEAGVSISKQLRKMAGDVLYMPPAPAAPPISVSIGDVHVSGVNDPNGLAKAIVGKLPNAVLRELYRR